MQKSRYLYSIALFLSVLIISLPFYVSSAYAQIDNVKVYGQDGVDGIVRQRDTLNFEAYIDSTEDITSSQVVLKPNRQFDECHADINYYKCTFDAGERLSDPDSSNSYTVEYTDSTPTLHTYPGSWIVDKEPPRVSSLSITPGTTAGPLTITYSVRDYGYSSKCSGINRVELYVDDALEETETIESDRCTESGTFDFELTSDGTYELCMKVFDNFDIESEEECKDITVDSSAPQYSDFSINDDDDNPVEFVGSSRVNAELLLNISSTDIDENTIWAVLSSFNDGYENETPSGTSINRGVLTAEWSVRIDIDDSTDGAFIVGFGDLTGNAQTFDLSWPITKDITGPEFTSIISNKQAADGYYVTASPTTLTAQITEAGIGLNETDVYLDLSALGQGNKQADYCDAGWTCYWEGITSSLSDGSTFSIKAGLSTEDLLGNPLTEQLSVQFISDSSLPFVTGFSYTPEYPTSSDTLEIAFNVTEATSGIASVQINATDISSEGIKDVTCSTEDDQVYECSVSVSSLASQYTSANVGILITDGAGNEFTSSHNIKVYRISSSTPNFFSVSSVETIPSRIDRKTASQVAMPFFIHPTLSGSANIMAMDVSCSNLGSVSLMNEDALDPYINGRLSSALGDASSVELSCTLYLYVQQGTRVYASPEEEQITAEVSLYNVALGEIGSQAQRKIANIESEISDVEDSIEALESWNNILSIIASVVELIQQIDSILNGIKSVLLGVMSLIPAIGLATWVATVCEPITMFHGFVVQYLWPPGLIPWTGLSLGWFVKYSVMIYSCRLCDASTYVNLALDVASHAITSSIREKAETKRKTDMDGDGIPDTEDDNVNFHLGSREYTIDAEGTILRDGNPVTGDELTSLQKLGGDSLTGWQATAQGWETRRREEAIRKAADLIEGEVRSGVLEGDLPQDILDKLERAEIKEEDLPLDRPSTDQLPFEDLPEGTIITENIDEKSYRFEKKNGRWYASEIGSGSDVKNLLVGTGGNQFTYDLKQHYDSGGTTRIPTTITVGDDTYQLVTSGDLQGKYYAGNGKYAYYENGVLKASDGIQLTADRIALDTQTSYLEVNQFDDPETSISLVGEPGETISYKLDGVETRQAIAPGSETATTIPETQSPSDITGSSLPSNTKITAIKATDDPNIMKLESNGKTIGYADLSQNVYSDINGENLIGSYTDTEDGSFFSTIPSEPSAGVPIDIIPIGTEDLQEHTPELGPANIDSSTGTQQSASIIESDTSSGYPKTIKVNGLQYTVEQENGAIHYTTIGSSTQMGFRSVHTEAQLITMARESIAADNLQAATAEPFSATDTSNPVTANLGQPLGNTAGDIMEGTSETTVSTSTPTSTNTPTPEPTSTHYRPTQTPTPPSPTATPTPTPNLVQSPPQSFWQRTVSFFQNLNKQGETLVGEATQTTEPDKPSDWDKAKSSWKESGKQTQIHNENLINSGQWLFNPYKSIHYAYGCLCLPGILFNLRKERQIYCMQKTCIEETAALGLPTTSCDVAASDRWCLYVDSAQYKLHGFFGDILDRLLDAIMNNLMGIVNSIAYPIVCPEDFTPAIATTCGVPHKNALCGVWGAAMGMMEFINTIQNIKFDFNKYNADLEGADYCE